MKNDIIHFLLESRVFSSLDERASRLLASHFTEVKLAQAEILFYQGDASDSIYILFSGKLAAELTTQASGTRIVGYIKPGETVGELGALSSEPRTLTVKALQDSVLLKLPAKHFVDICHQYPSVMFATLHPIITRSKNLIRMLSAKKTGKHVVIVPANKNISLQAFMEKLQGYAEKYSTLLMVSDYQPEFNDKNGDVSLALKTLIQSKKSLRKVVYFLKSHQTPLAKIAFKKADLIYIVGENASEPSIARALIEKVNKKKKRSRLAFDPCLILLHQKEAPMHTMAWLKLMPFGLHHHVRMNNTSDFKRLLRFIRGKAVGLVLSGGGTRGWAHLGVIKALRETKTPIDIVGGTSAGAIAGACYALHQSYEDAYDNLYKIIVGSTHSTSWRSLTWPVISLFDAKKFTQSQENVFGKINIEDLWLPYFCVSTNLTKNMEEIHREGLLWERTRASTSIPGIIPPMIINGEMHLDGGLLNNLPVDVMRQFVGEKGKIIAVELNSFVSQRRKYTFPPILTFKTVLWAKLGLTKEKFKFPPFIDTFLRGLFISSATKVKQNSLAATLFISLNLAKFRLLNADIKQAKRLIDIGYKETLKQINKAKQKKE